MVSYEFDTYTNLYHSFYTFMYYTVTLLILYLTAPFVVTLTDKLVQSEPVQCKSAARVSVGKQQHSLHCSSYVSHDMVRAQLLGLGSMSICEIRIYGGLLRECQRCYLFVVFFLM